MAKYARQKHRLSERQACRMLALSRSVFRYQARKPEDGEIVQELFKMAGWREYLNKRRQEIDQMINTIAKDRLRK